MIAGLLSFVAGPFGRWVVISLLVAAAVAAAGLRLYNAGYAAHEAETSAEIAEANRRARMAERVATERMSQVATEHRKVVTDAQSKIDRLRADLRSGARRLSIPTVAGVSVCADSAVAGGSEREIRSALDPATADALVAIAADGDAAIRQANALIDAYAIAESVCGK